MLKCVKANHNHKKYFSYKTMNVVYMYVSTFQCDWDKKRVRKVIIMGNIDSMIFINKKSYTIAENSYALKANGWFA